MISSSPFPRISILDVDIWSFLFERADREYPDDKVLFTDADSGRNFTYADIRKLALNFGQTLRQRWNWQKGDVLAIFAPNSIDLPPMIWGTLAVGGTICPINPNYRAEELIHPLKDSRAQAVVTQKTQSRAAYQAAERAGISSNRVIVIDEPGKDSIWESNPRAIPDHAFHGPWRTPIVDPSREVAFLVYSSGTSGLPKGVLLSHRNMVANLLQSASVDQGVLGWNRGLHGEGDKALALLPFFHIYGLTYLLNHTVFLGISTFVMPRFDLDKFCSAIQRDQITYAYVVPPIILELVRNPRVRQYDLRSLRMMLSAAAPLAVELIHELREKLNLSVRQAYGMSECAPCTHMQCWDEAVTHAGSTGRLLPNMTAKYADVEGESSSKSKELWVKGPNVFLGYLNNPKANSEVFSEDGYYKTGDVGFEDENGHFFITDRVKELIKYNGFQVAPAELEGIVVSHPAVADVAVVGISSGQDGSELPRAYVVPRASHGPSESTANSIIKFVKGQVISYKQLRGGVRFVDTIPRNPSGKILRREIKRLDRQKERPSKL